MATWTEINTYFLPLERGLFFGDADLYRDDLSADEYPFWAITFIRNNAWHWDEMKHGYRLLIHDGRLTDEGRVQIDRLLHVSPPMVDYDL